MKTKFLNLKNLKYILRGTPLTAGEAAESMERSLEDFNRQTGIPDDIIRWNIQFKNHSGLHPLVLNRDPNDPFFFDPIEKDSPCPQKTRDHAAQATEDYKKWDTRTALDGTALGDDIIRLIIDRATPLEFADRLKEQKESYPNLSPLLPPEGEYPDWLPHNPSSRCEKENHIVTCQVATFERNPLPDEIKEIVESASLTIRTNSTERAVDSSFVEGRCGAVFNTDLPLHGGKKTVPLVLNAPLRILLRGSKDLEGTYTVYFHALSTHEDEEFIYYGLTRRGWQIRFGEHWREQNYQTRRLFPLKIRDLVGCDTGVHIGPQLSGITSSLCSNGMTQNHAMAAEEYLVDKYSLNSKHPNGLNMIPGGYAGIKALHKLRGKDGAPLVSENQKNQFMSTEQREKILDGYLLQNPRVGIPNPGAAEKWKDDAYAEAVICGPENRLNPDQVRETRYLSATGLEPEVILQKVGALNLRQVEGVLSGKHYSRIT